MFKMDTWLKRVLLAVLASLCFLRFGRQTLLLINVMSLHLIVVEDLNRECFFFKLHSFCIFLLSLKNLKLHKKKIMSNSSSSGGSNSLQHSLISFKSASTDHTPSPPPSPVHPPLPFPIHLLPPQIFIPKEVAPFN